jgi:hypothetical protein
LGHRRQALSDVLFLFVVRPVFRTHFVRASIFSPQSFLWKISHANDDIVLRQGVVLQSIFPCFILESTMEHQAGQLFLRETLLFLTLARTWRDVFDVLDWPGMIC